MIKTKRINYETPTEAQEAYDYLTDLIEPEDHITICQAHNAVIIAASETDIKALMLMLAHVDL